MTALATQGNNYVLTFPKDLLTDKQIAKLMELIGFERLVRNNQMNVEDAEALSEELKADWWKANESRIMEKINAA
jgi:hypothetical protein